MYYYRDHHLYNYYAKYNDLLFKSKEEYLGWANTNGYQLSKVSYFRLSKWARKTDEYPEGAWVEYDVVPGTILFDDRIFSHYEFADETEAMEFVKSYNEYPDGYASQTFFEGYPGDENPFAYVEPDIAIEPFDAAKQCKQFAHFIISYMPDDPTRRKARMDAHKLQIRNIKMITPQAKIYIVAQNWAESEYMTDPQIEYKKFPQGLGAGKARNECLRWLYASDYSWGIISDDDICLKVTDSAIQFHKDLETNAQAFTDSPIDICFSRALVYDRWNLEDVFKAEELSENWIFRTQFENQFHWAVVRNFKKFYGKEEYQKEDLDTARYDGFDDIDFCLYLTQKGYHLYLERNLQRMISCMTEHESIVQEFAKGDYISKNLTSARSRYLKRNANGYWDYGDLFYRSGHPGDFSIPRTVQGDVYNEIQGPRTDDMKHDYQEAISRQTRF